VLWPCRPAWTRLCVSLAITKMMASAPPAAHHAGRGGGGGGGGGGGNRFAPLAGTGQGGGGGGGGGRGPAREDWRAVVRVDMASERPAWPATCYGHVRGGRCDWEGDVSFEEARWAQLQALRAGRPAAALIAELPAAAAVQNRLYQARSLARGVMRHP